MSLVDGFWPSVLPAPVEQVRRRIVDPGPRLRAHIHPQLRAALAFTEAYQRLGHCRWRWFDGFPPTKASVKGGWGAANTSWPLSI